MRDGVRLGARIADQQWCGKGLLQSIDLRNIQTSQTRTKKPHAGAAKQGRVIGRLLQDLPEHGEAGVDHRKVEGGDRFKDRPYVTLGEHHHRHAGKQWIEQ